jgi:hypothetical protein
MDREMKIYVICFDNECIRYPNVFLDRKLAEKRLKIIRDNIDAQALQYKKINYSHWYSIDEMEVEEEPMTLEEVFDL